MASYQVQKKKQNKPKNPAQPYCLFSEDLHSTKIHPDVDTHGAGNMDNGVKTLTEKE